jgi:hypothetical protein
MNIPLKIAYVTISFVAFMVRSWFARRCSPPLAQSIQLSIQLQIEDIYESPDICFEEVGHSSCDSFSIAWINKKV